MQSICTRPKHKPSLEWSIRLTRLKLQPTFTGTEVSVGCFLLTKEKIRGIINYKEKERKNYEYFQKETYTNYC